MIDTEKKMNQLPPTIEAALEGMREHVRTQLSGKAVEIGVDDLIVVARRNPDTTWRIGVGPREDFLRELMNEAGPLDPMYLAVSERPKPGFSWIVLATLDEGTFLAHIAFLSSVGTT